jgi:hypothetical protein
MAKFLIVMLLIAPWIFLPSNAINDQFRLPQACVMDIAFLGIIAMSFFWGNRLIYRNKWLSCLVGWVFLNFIIFFFIPFSLDYRNHGRMLNTGCLEPMIHIFLGLWAIQIILSNFEREDYIRIAKALCISSCLISAFALLQFFGLDPLMAVGATYNCGNMVSACLDNPNLVGSYLVLCLPLFLMFKKVKYGLGAVLVVIGIYATKCHFAQFLAVASIMLYFLIKYRKNKVVIISILSIGLLGLLAILKFDFLKLHSGMDGRLFVWKMACHKIKMNPLIGHGIGIWRSYGIRTNSGSVSWLFVHNDWLERTVEMGLIGIALLIGVVVHSIRNFSFEEEGLGYFCMFTTFLLLMIGSFPWEVATIATLGIISFCAVEKL